MFRNGPLVGAAARLLASTLETSRDETMRGFASTRQETHGILENWEAFSHLKKYCKRLLISSHLSGRRRMMKGLMDVRSMAFPTSCSVGRAVNS